MTSNGGASDAEPSGPDRPGSVPSTPQPPRPLIERLGLGLIALVLTLAFGAIAAFAWVGGEVFLAVMAGIGGLMTLWAGASSLRRG